MHEFSSAIEKYSTLSNWCSAVRCLQCTCCYWCYHGHQCLYEQLINCSGCFSCASFILHLSVLRIAKKMQEIIDESIRSDSYVLLASIPQTKRFRFHSCYFCELACEMCIQYACLSLRHSDISTHSSRDYAAFVGTNPFYSYYWQW